MSHKTKNKNQIKTSKKRIQCALDTTIRKQTQITLIRHEPSYKQRGGKERTKRNNDLFYSLNVYKKRVIYHFVNIIKTLTLRSG